MLKLRSATAAIKTPGYDYSIYHNNISFAVFDVELAALCPGTSKGPAAIPIVTTPAGKNGRSAGDDDGSDYVQRFSWTEGIHQRVRSEIRR